MRQFPRNQTSISVRWETWQRFDGIKDDTHMTANNLLWSMMNVYEKYRESLKPKSEVYKRK